MSIVDTYKDQFRIFSFDEDITRSDRLGAVLKKQGFDVTVFNSRGLFLETLPKDLPHIILLYYQPLNLKFRDTLNKIREVSSEVEVVVLGGSDFWPGIHSLIKAGLADDFWTWPVAGQEVFEIRLNKIIEKNIYKFIAEQRSDETQEIVARLENLKATPEEFQQTSVADTQDLTTLISTGHKTEAQMIEEFVNNFKSQYTTSEFVYFKNYRAKSQLLVTRTSFATENYFRGQSIPFVEDRFRDDRGESLTQIRNLIEETFACEDFIMQPVEFGDDFFGLIMAVNCQASPFLQKTARYLSLALRNFRLENEGSHIEVDKSLDQSVGSSQFPLVLSTEISRARRLKLPVSLIVGQIEYVGDNGNDFQKAFNMIRNNLRNYDILCHLKENQVAVILPHCDYENAAIKAETIRRQLVARGLKNQNTPLRMCFGVSEFPNLSVDSDALFSDAQKACSQVVVSGKNKVCLFTAPQGFQPEFVAQV